MDLRADLRALDDRVVPRWARRVQGVRGRLAATPGPATLLRGLDDRYASRGVLRVVRDVPVLGALVCTAVLLAGTGTSVALAWTGEQPGEQAAPRVALGVPVGADVDAHLTAAHERAVALARQAPSARLTALVSLRDELTVAQTARLVAESGLEIRTTWVRAPVGGLPELFRVETGSDPARTLAAFFTATAERKAAEQAELVALARSTGAAGTEQAEVRSSYAAAAATAGREAAAYGDRCACVLAVLLEGPAVELAELPSLPAVRGVEVAPRGAGADAVDVTPLAPEVTGVVPATAAER